MQGARGRKGKPQPESSRESRRCGKRPPQAAGDRDRAQGQRGQSPARGTGSGARAQQGQGDAHRSAGSSPAARRHGSPPPAQHGEEQRTQITAGMVQLERRKSSPPAPAEPGVEGSPSLAAVGWIWHPRSPSHPDDLSTVSQCWLPCGSYRHSRLSLLPTLSLGARTALGTSRGRWEAGPGRGWPGSAGIRSPTCCPLSPGMPGTPRVPGTDCPGGPRSPCKGHSSGPAWWLWSPSVHPAPWMCQVPDPCTLGQLCRWGWGWRQGWVLRLPSPGQGDTREEPTAGTELGHGS